MPLSPSATRELLERLGLHPSRQRGQNFLVDGNIVRKSLELAEVRPGDAVVEIGPGLGTLTTALLAAGARVYAIEVDRGLHAYLAAEIVPGTEGRLHLIHGDAVDLPRAGLPTADEADYLVVANLPYAISTPWLDGILCGPLPRRMVLMLQREAAARYVAAPGTRDFGAISIFCQAAFNLQPGHPVAASCFYPRPEVESTLLHLARRDPPVLFSPAARALLRLCFAHRRQQMGRLLREHAAPEVAAAWGQALAARGHPLTARPEQIPVASWIACLGAPAA